jgi:tRNA 2-selenouridine synthase
MEPAAGNGIGEALARAGTVVDVRTPAEFTKGAVAGAVNIPLFDNAERAEIGTLYKQIGKQEAVQAGLKFVGGRLAGFIEAFEPYREAPLLVYCARGGMRSQSVVSLLASLGYEAAQLPGGYKAYRNYLLDALEREIPPRPIVIHGRTGVGKTLLLQRLTNALDLEELAQHRSSLFGAVNLQPRTQQQFETLLLQTLRGLDFARPVWIEGESRKVGSVTLPDSLRRAMQGGTCVLVTASLPTRVRRIIEEYGGEDPDTLAQLEEALRSLTRLMGKQPVARLVDCLRAGDLATVVETLLVDYYDPRYLHAMRDYRYALELSSEDLDAAAAELLAFAAELSSPGEPLRAAGAS